MTDGQTITINVSEEFIGQVEALVKSHAEAVRMGQFREADALGSPSTFPLLSPHEIEALKQATIILGTGSAAVNFLAKLQALIAASKGKVSARDDKTKKPV